MLVSHSHRFVFVHIPKTAGTSITQILEPYCEKAPDNRVRRLMRKLGVRQDPTRAHFRSHDTARHVLSAFGPETFAAYRVFSVIRNPFDHAVSHYAFMRDLEDARYASVFRRLGFADYLRYRLHPPLFNRAPPFARIADQTGFVADRQGSIIVNQLLRFETLDTDIAALLERLGLPPDPLPRARVTAGRRQTLADYYSSGEAADLVRRLYACDFDNFGYSTDWRTAASETL